MTDNEILKALEEFHHRILKTNLSYHIRESEMMAVCDAISLINRQKAEIERLQKSNKEYSFCNLLGNVLVYSKTLKDYNDMRKGLKSEAIKGFAEKIKQVLELNDLEEYNYVCKLLDVLVKEMTE